MNQEMKNKLSNILDEVKDPETGLPVSQLGLIEGIKHKADLNELLVYMNSLETAKACCMVSQFLGYAKIEELLKEALEKEFPNQTVVFQNP